MFGWLRRFDNWLEAQEKPAYPDYTEREPSAPKYDWDAREKIVRAQASTAAAELVLQREKEQANAVASFEGVVSRQGHMLTITTNGNSVAINLNFLVTAHLTLGQPVAAEGAKWVDFNETEWAFIEDAWGLEDVPGWHGFWQSNCPSCASPDRLLFVGVDQEIKVPHGCGRTLYNLVISAIGSKES